MNLYPFMQNTKECRSGVNQLNEVPPPGFQTKKGCTHSAFKNYLSNAREQPLNS